MIKMINFTISKNNTLRPFWVILLSTLVFNNFIFAQTKTNRNKLLKFATELKVKAERERAEAYSYAAQHNLPIRKEFPDGRVIEIQRIKNGLPIYYITDNLGAARTTRADDLWPGGILGLSLTGSTFDSLGEWDSGAIRATHQEFGTRIVQVDGASTLSDHSTHVAGTMIAAGVQANAQGMAYQAILYAHDWDYDDTEMATAAANGLKISNHSYSSGVGWSWNAMGDNRYLWWGDVSISTTEDFNFGFYDSQSQNWDQISYNAPYYLITKSAGNDRGDGPTPGTEHWFYNGSTWTLSTATRDLDGGTTGYDCIGNRGVAKNLLTVGAVGEVTNYTDPSDVIISNFSSWGPADDGRIKPDIVAKGVNVYSSIATSNTAYDTYDGTSMSSPNAAGTMTLLQQHYQNIHNDSSMLSSTLKALVIHSADEAGSYNGPDYIFGWGLMNANQAAEIILDDLDQNVIDEITLSNGGSYSRAVTASGTEPLRVTIVWTDPPGTPVVPAIDPSDPMLVNDLDLRITRNGTTYYPWRLDRNNPTYAATNDSENNVDNVEQVYIANPEAATYTITVDHDGTLEPAPNRIQTFGIIISGIDEYTGPPSSCSADLISPGDGTTDVPLTITIEWASVGDATSYDLYFWTDVETIVDGEIQPSTIYGPNLSPNTTYYVQVYPRNNQGVNSSCSTIWSFTTGSVSIITSFPYTENFDGFSIPDGIGSGNDWENAADDDFDWTVNSGSTPSSNTGPSSDHTSGSGRYLFTEASTPNYPLKLATLLSPLLNLNALPNPTMEFWHHMWDGNDIGMGNIIVDIYDNGYWNNNVYSKSGDQGNSWHVATIDLTPYKNGSVQQLRFRVITDTWSNDISIDDFYIHPEALHTYTAGNTELFTFDNTDASIQFTSGNSGDVTLIVVKYNSDPGTFGSLPDGVMNVSPDSYWEVTVESGTVESNYNITLDLDGMSGISEYATLYLLKRDNSSSPWSNVGTNNYAGTGTAVLWSDISGGFSQFGIGGGLDNSLPITLRNFEAEYKSGYVVLLWSTASEINNESFTIERGKDKQNFRFIASIPGHGNSSTLNNYKYEDRSISPNKKYYYRLSDIDFSGNITYHPIISVETSLQVPENFKLYQNYPNPFNPNTTIKFDLPATENHFHKIEINIYNSTGQNVRHLLKEKLSAGSFERVWDGKNNFGQKLPSGVYYLRLTTEEYNSTQKMILLK
jgi:hypothetical protein